MSANGSGGARFAHLAWVVTAALEEPKQADKEAKPSTPRKAQAAMVPHRRLRRPPHHRGARHRAGGDAVGAAVLRQPHDRPEPDVRRQDRRHRRPPLARRVLDRRHPPRQDHRQRARPALSSQARRPGDRVAGADGRRGRRPRRHATSRSSTSSTPARNGRRTRPAPAGRGWRSSRTCSRSGSTACTSTTARSTSAPSKPSRRSTCTSRT